MHADRNQPARLVVTPEQMIRGCKILGEFVKAVVGGQDRGNASRMTPEAFHVFHERVNGIKVTVAKILSGQHDGQFVVREAFKDPEDLGSRLAVRLTYSLFRRNATPGWLLGKIHRSAQRDRYHSAAKNKAFHGNAPKAETDKLSQV